MKFDIVRAWKDESYRQGLSNEERNMLPANPAGDLELTDAELESAFGGQSAQRPVTVVKETNVVSFALLACEVNIYSINVVLATIASFTPQNIVCIKTN